MNRSSKLVLPLLLALSALLTACSGEGDETTPELLDFTPRHGDVNIPVRAAVEMTFVTPMDSQSLRQAFRLTRMSDGLVIQGALVVSGVDATFTPSRALEHGTAYVATLSSSARSADGQTLPEGATWTFTTAQEPGPGPTPEPTPDPTPDGGLQITTLQPAQLAGSGTTVTLRNLGPFERVAVIPLNTSQTITRTAPDGASFLIQSSGVQSSPELPRLASRGVLGKARQPLLSLKDSDRRERAARAARAGHTARLSRVSELMGTGSPRLPRLGRAEPGTAGFGKCSGPYTVGATQCSFAVLNASDAFEAVPATAVHVSANAVIFVQDDRLGEVSAAQLQRLADEFESVSLPVILANFGGLPDSDANGRTILMFTDKLIAPGASSGVLGYVAPWDLMPDTTFGPDLISNEGDIFYAALPASVGLLGYTENEYFDEIMPGTMVHELKHLSAVGTRTASGVPNELLWLEEPSAVAAEQLAGYGTVSGSIQLMAEQALASPQDFRVRHADRPDSIAEDFAMYGFNFLMLWTIGERTGHSFWRPWVAGPGNDIANLSAHAGRAFPELMSDWALTMLFDNSSVQSSYSYAGLNLRDGSWAALGTQGLGAVQSLQVRSMAYFIGRGTGGDARITVSSGSSAHALVVRYPE